jgi:hypothetical protein
MLRAPLLGIRQRQELPDDVPCCANCLKSGLRHACVKSPLFAVLTCLHSLLTNDARMLGVLGNVMYNGQVIHDGAPEWSQYEQ